MRAYALKARLGMATAGLFIGWSDPVPGRETKVLEIFNESIAFYTRMQEEGVIEDFELPHGELSFCARSNDDTGRRSGQGRVPDVARTVLAVPAVSALIQRARESSTSVIYVNDNYGDWNSSAEELAKAALEGRHPELVEPVLPPQGSSFVIKPRHSAFYQTPLEYLLYRQGAERLVLTGQVTEQCILYSALDAYVRHFDVVVPTDAVAHIQAA